MGGHEGAPSAYVDALLRQATATRRALGPHQLVQGALGGGTPTYLSPNDLDRLLSGIDWAPGAGPLSVETSPDTVDDERLAVLGAHGATRVSMGVQSFDDEEVRALGRPQRRDQVEAALGLLRGGPWALNLDLMYGMAGQTVPSFLASIEAALAWEPEELFLYPLYVRPLTGLARSQRTWDDERLQLYRAGRDRLLSCGYDQRSMRSFRRSGHHTGDAPDGTTWCCQDDGMVGLGAGARSYTAAVHWSTEYAVGQVEVRRIVTQFTHRSEEEHALAHVGIELGDGEQRRRWVIKSVLRREGLQVEAYRTRFQGDPCTDVPLLGDLVQAGYLDHLGDRIVPTALGLERSDAIGPALVSDAVRRLSTGCPIR